jgi:fatty-acid peroxygenase
VPIRSQRSPIGWRTGSSQYSPGIAAPPVEARTLEFRAMLDAAGAAGPRVLRGLWRRRQCEAWVRDRLERIRDGRLEIAPEAPAAVVARHLEPGGAALPIDVAAKELINLLRPIVAVARYVVFCALSLHQRPDTAAGLTDPAARLAFAREVRRFHPFFSLVGGRALSEQSFRGETIPQGAWVLLDIFGILHDPREWPDPGRFEPGRFAPGPGDPFDIDPHPAEVPQGGGDRHLGHRCPGEPATLALMVTALPLLLATPWRVTQADLSLDLGRMPAMPAGWFRVSVAPTDGA